MSYNNSEPIKLLWTDSADRYAVGYPRPPCIMYVQYRGGCSVPWGYSVLWGDIMINVEGYLEYRGGVQYRGGISWVLWGVILSTVGDDLEYRGGVQHRGRYSWCTWGISWVPWSVFSTVEGYHPLKFEYHGGISLYMWGISWVPWRVFSTVGYSNNKRFFSPRYWTPSTVLMISPHVHHDIPHSTEHPPWYSR